MTKVIAMLSTRNNGLLGLVEH